MKVPPRDFPFRVSSYFTMGPKFKAIAAYALIFSPAIASIIPNNAREAKCRVKCADNVNVTVDLDYAVYQGYTNTTSGLNIWKGYTTPPNREISLLN